MTELTPDQQRNLDATVAAVQRVAMHIVTLPKKQRAEQLCGRSKDIRGIDPEVRG
jgi:hypothetical protein